MLVNGAKLPYTEVAYEFARNPSGYVYSISPKYGWGVRLRNRRLESEIIPIPVVFSRRGHENMSWDDIIEELTSILYRDEDVSISFSHGDTEKYYSARVTSIFISEEHEYVAKGVIEIMCEDQCMFGEDRRISVDTEFNSNIIRGQLSPVWYSTTRFSEGMKQFTLEISSGTNIVLNYDFIEGDVLDIDAKRRSVFVNGSNIDVSISLETEWDKGEIPVGNVQLKASHPTEIVYTERYY